MTKIFKPALLFLLVGAAMPAHASEAGDAGAAEASGESNDIVVTGMKFDRTLQDTPESVKVFTSEDVERQNLISVYDLIDRIRSPMFPIIGRTAPSKRTARRIARRRPTCLRLMCRCRSARFSRCRRSRPIICSRPIRFMMVTCCRSSRLTEI